MHVCGYLLGIISVGFELNFFFELKGDMSFVWRLYNLTTSFVNINRLIIIESISSFSRNVVPKQCLFDLKLYSCCSFVSVIQIGQFSIACSILSKYFDGCQCFLICKQFKANHMSNRFYKRHSCNRQEKCDIHLLLLHSRCDAARRAFFCIFNEADRENGNAHPKTG